MNTAKKDINLAKLSQLEIFIAANSEKTYSKQELTTMFNSCDFKFLASLGITDPKSISVLCHHNISHQLSGTAIYNKYSNTAYMQYGKTNGFLLVTGNKLNAVEMDILKATKKGIHVFIDIPVGKLWEKSTDITFLQPIESITVDVKKGDLIKIMECDEVEALFEVQNQSILKITGDISQYTGETKDAEGNVVHEGYQYVNGYCVEHPAIKGTHYRTFTDIGGKWLYVNNIKICHLSNGFGDGNYTMRFSEGLLTR